MNRDDALALACGPLCLQVHEVLVAATQGVSVSVGLVDEGTDVVTWLAKGARFFTLIQTPQGTRVYDHADDLLYLASPAAQLRGDCPCGHAFLCQTVCDQQEGGQATPRLLVMDLVVPAIACPRERNRLLRGLAPVLPPVCHLQWAGDKKALREFVDSGAVPHRVEALVALRAPLHLVRESGTGISALDVLDLPR